ncbi:DUF1127 domain-containing protein [Halocynthiibacter sp. C4]|uniref:DUF1127 domain-containing protein n=1 Tax=Halocynthiibacter sp. C4 TaxID=2992758 RepID=UPI00237BC6EB|nr:DUF1127 domain-containing protein [Halocynthiibacter sp. C4]MDE0588677.1 DUF1127 domain-containing protein [Halocynthiibacter sp. C4]
MAVTTVDTRSFANGASFAGRTLNYVASVLASLAAWNDARVTRATLNKLSDHELNDIGLCRADIAKF